MKKWIEVFNRIFEEDNYTPVQCETHADFQAIVDIYPFHDDELERVIMQFRSKGLQSAFIYAIQNAIPAFASTFIPRLHTRKCSRFRN